MSIVKTYTPDQLSDAQRFAMFDLFWHVWPRTQVYKDAIAQFNPSAQRKTDAEINLVRFIVWDGDLAVAHTGIFSREVYTERGVIRVGALSGVCTHEDYRQRGYAAQTVRAAFEQIDHSVYPVALWMTTVPAFYEKLGARIVHNPWVNRQNTDNPEADPWPDEEKMIYPADFLWPEGVIDLNGGAY
jgi:predicted GNAT family acetyltransferase